MDLLGADLAAMAADPVFATEGRYSPPAGAGGRPGQVARGWLDIEETYEPGADGVVQVRRTVWRVPDGALTGLAIDAPIRVGGRAYTVRRFDLMGDGKVLEIVLAEA